jgi:hypothetical protein
VLLKGLVIGFSIASRVGPFVGIFPGLGLFQANEGSVVTLVLGVFIGSGIWWNILCFVVGLFKGSLKKQTLIWINRLSGLITFLFGIYSFWGLLH